MRSAFTLLALIAIAAVAKADCPGGVCSMLATKKVAPVVHRQAAEPPRLATLSHAEPAPKRDGFFARLFNRPAKCGR